MADDAPDALFLGDLTDPWVVEIADALPRGTIRRVHECEPSDEDLALLRTARCIIVHHATLGPREGEALRLLKERDGGQPPKLILCIGPHVRARDLERWAGVADLVLPEATASETIARHVGANPCPRSPRPAVTVIGGTFEARRVVAEMCDLAGFAARPYASWDDAPLAPIAVWDVPVLEPEWPRVLAEKATRREVIALIGLADRASVAMARTAGASACLDNTCEPADLAFVLDRIAASSAIDPPHPVPPPPRLGVRAARPAKMVDPRRES